MRVSLLIHVRIFLVLCHNEEQNKIVKKREIPQNEGDFTFHNFLAGKWNDKSCGLSRKCTFEMYVTVDAFFPNQKIHSNFKTNVNDQQHKPQPKFPVVVF